MKGINCHGSAGGDHHTMPILCGIEIVKIDAPAGPLGRSRREAQSLSPNLQRPLDLFCFNFIIYLVHVAVVPKLAKVALHLVIHIC